MWDKLMETFAEKGLSARKQICKLVLVSAVLLVMLLLSISSLKNYGTGIYNRENYDNQKNIAESIDATYMRLMENEENARNNYYTFLEGNARMTAAVLRSFAANEEYNGPYYMDRGFVVHYEDGKYVAPDGINVDMNTLDLEGGSRTTTIVSDYSGWYEADVFVQSLDNDYYYVDWDATYEARDFVDSYCNTSQVISQMEEALDGSILINRKNEEGNTLLYRSEALSEIDDTTLAGFDISAVNEKDHSYEYEGKSYIVAGSSQSEDYDLYYFVPMENHVFEASRWVTLFVVFTIVVLVSALAWNFAVQKLVRERVLSSVQERYYKPRHMLITNVGVCLLSAILLFTMSVFNQALSSLYASALRGQEILNGIAASIQQEDDRKFLSTYERNNCLKYYAQQLGTLLSFDLDYAHSETLQGVNEAIGSNYVMLFDPEGNELCSSNGFVGYSLLVAEDGASESDFKYLLNGVDTIVHEPAYDERTKMFTQLVGARIPIDDSFGAVVIAFDGYYDENIVSSVDVMINSVSRMNDLAVVIDKEYNAITYTSDDNYYGYSPEVIGIKENSAFLHFYNIGGVKRYGVNKETDKYRFCYFMEESGIISQNLDFGFACTALFIALYAVMYAITSYGYTDDFFKQNILIGKPVARGAKIQIQTADGRTKNSTEASKRFAFIPQTLSEMLPEQKTLFVFDTMLALIILNSWLGISSGSFADNDSLIGFIMQGNWSKGVNLFAATSIFLMIIEFSFGLMLLRVLTSLLCMVLDTKGETICRLIYNILRYFAIIAMLYYAFTDLGFNTTGLLASVSFLTLAISIGAKDLIADILAGISIVFEGDYQVGDMVEIANYRGQVQEVGVRSTKLLGRGDNIKIINNRDVKNVLNMTRLNSWYPVEVRIPRTYSLDEVEVILREELPKIGERNKEIISGPYYYGVLKMEKDAVTLSILAECREEDYHRVQRLLNKELYDLFQAKGIPLA